MSKPLIVSITPHEKTVKRLASVRGGTDNEARIRRAFQTVYGKTPEDVFADVIDNTVWEASIPGPE